MKAVSSYQEILYYAYTPANSICDIVYIISLPILCLIIVILKSRQKCVINLTQLLILITVLVIQKPGTLLLEKKPIHHFKHSYKRIICQWCTGPVYSVNKCFKFKYNLASKTKQTYFTKQHHNSSSKKPHSSDPRHSPSKNSTYRRKTTNKSPHGY